ncbi:fimbrial biogenesis chaperone [Collimonas antrihumi]|uniref:fimbrial biogenesis chaperone n=1 Tax=Collimonas antrihumi TaxID=1940615 RepID=UPI001B8A8D87|nr:hypothetical protein [Collimonas antrihumi]
MFFRPENLKGSVEDSASGLQWKLVKDGIETALEVRNPSAFHVSFSRVALVLDGKEIESENRPMVAPGKTERFVLNGLPVTPGVKAEVRFKTIDDYGGAVSHAVAL